jgi:hypothetical protein
MPLPKVLQNAAGGLDQLGATGIDAPTAEEDAEITWAMGVPAEVWFGISAWAKKTDSLASWQRSIAFSLGKLAGQSKPPSRKQAAQGRKLHDDAVRLGFLHEATES